MEDSIYPRQESASEKNKVTEWVYYMKIIVIETIFM